MNKTLDQLILYATDENWVAMDALIPSVAQDLDVIQWCLQTGLKDENDTIRDLAVSILEKSQYKLNEQDISLLETLMESDKNIYVEYRAAFTLFNRGIHSEAVMQRMHDALVDDDVKDIAAAYLGIKI